MKALRSGATILGKATLSLMSLGAKKTFMAIFANFRWAEKEPDDIINQV